MNKIRPAYWRMRDPMEQGGRGAEVSQSRPSQSNQQRAIQLRCMSEPSQDQPSLAQSSRPIWLTHRFVRNNQWCFKLLSFGMVCCIAIVDFPVLSYSLGNSCPVPCPVINSLIQLLSFFFHYKTCRNICLFYFLNFYFIWEYS